MSNHLQSFIKNITDSNNTGNDETKRSDQWDKIEEISKFIRTLGKVDETLATLDDLDDDDSDDDYNYGGATDYDEDHDAEKDIDKILDIDKMITNMENYEKNIQSQLNNMSMTDEHKQPAKILQLIDEQDKILEAIQQSDKVQQVVSQQVNVRQQVVSQQVEKQEQEQYETKNSKKDVKTDKSQLTCPITLEPFKDPVFFIDDGFTYEKEALSEWLEKKPKLSPMGFPIKTNKYVPNRTFANNFICPITLCEMVDPVIIIECGMTYEHDALMKLLKETYCKNWRIKLEFNFGKLGEEKITVLSNKVLWKEEHTAERKEFVMPSRKVYKGFQYSDYYKDTKHKDESCKVINIGRYISICEHDDGDNYKARNKKFTNSMFYRGCVKGRKIINCIFIDCVFKDVCFCSNFKNCRFDKCTFIKPTMSSEFHCNGTEFNKCLMVYPEIHKHDTGCYVKYCTSIPEIIDNFKKRGAIKVDIE
jgi:hypothetical protein